MLSRSLNLILQSLPSPLHILQQSSSPSTMTNPRSKPNKNEATNKKADPDIQNLSIKNESTLEKTDAGEITFTDTASDLGGGEITRLFNIIDQLRECGVAEDISLPQLVVVGDQSSGKSSLLEALTGIPFPVAATLCTRFATQINFRRAQHSSVQVVVLPSKDATGNIRAKKASKTYPKMTGLIFEKILAEASVEMGLPQPGETTENILPSTARFSDDVLKIDISGPDQPLFSVVDVPGLFQTATIHQTEDDIAIVEQLVTRYIKNPRTIIMAVASSLNDIANQKVIQLAKEADPKGSRTVGILTKPDAVQHGDESRVIEVAQNKVARLTHGWFVVRNRSPDEVRRGITADQRIINERFFFQKDPWNALEKSQVGCESLKTFLRKLLLSHIRKEYPLIVKELDNLYQRCRDDIKELGPPRETPEQQRKLLLEISNKFHMVTRDALMGNYQLSALEFKQLRLRTVIYDLRDKFVQEICSHGHLYFLDTKKDTEIRKIHDWICETYLKCRGPELPGLVNHTVMRILFQLQTEGWSKIAESLIESVKDLVDSFTQQLLAQTCGDPELRMNIWNLLDAEMEMANERAKEELQQILTDERGDILITHEVNFNSSVEESRKKRYISDLSGNKDESLDVSSRASLNAPKMVEEPLFDLFNRSFRTQEEQAILEIFDYLRSYYLIARSRFIDNVAIQVVERHFLGTGGSARSFSPKLVGELTDEQLQDVAGEDFGVVQQRRGLATRLERLEKAKKIARAGYGI
ncbi:hypothetical protein EX30DRAFT_397439 [Ascodesmis nigricans]|uniref:P-loop containing nucleoside triphosphate hydrolase protein n=1 Tax=Ascodesmis nigricans TaxID=341454 RepID=A0A4V3SI64_9PEZI|nr:hypothetical protein EX30DRAFT_397439 [Ascodesmis nigricans]